MPRSPIRSATVGFRTKRSRAQRRSRAHTTSTATTPVTPAVATEHDDTRVDYTQAALSLAANPLRAR